MQTGVNLKNGIHAKGKTANNVTAHHVISRLRIFAFQVHLLGFRFVHGNKNPVSNKTQKDDQKNKGRLSNVADRRQALHQELLAADLARILRECGHSLHQLFYQQLVVIFDTVRKLVSRKDLD